MKKILIVDDNELNITILLNTLGSTYDLSVALSGQEALDAIEEELPDLIVLDIIMDGISGLDICEKIKAEERTKHIPVVFLTAAHDAMKETAYKAGADDFMGKPFEGAVLRAKIQRLLEA